MSLVELARMLLHCRLGRCCLLLSRPLLPPPLLSLLLLHGRRHFEQ